MNFKHVTMVLAVVVSMSLVAASAEEGLEAAKADSGSLVGDMNVGGHGLSGPGAVRASLGLKKDVTALTGSIKKSIAKVPGLGGMMATPRSGSTSGRSGFLKKEIFYTAFSAVGLALGAGVGALTSPIGVLIGAGLGCAAGAAMASSILDMGTQASGR